MAETSIQWTDHSINPIRARLLESGTVGHYCEKIAPGCKNCYASNLQKRFQMLAFGGGQLRDKVEIFLDESKLDEVRRRKKPTKYFWCDMSDLFGDWVKPEWVAKCFATMDATPQHTHQLLTKRPENIRKMWPLLESKRTIFPGCPGPLGEPQPCVVEGAYRSNVWLGTSISDQQTAETAVPELLKCRNLSPVLFLSAEPLLGPVNLEAIQTKSQWPGKSEYAWLNALYGFTCSRRNRFVLNGIVEEKGEQPFVDDANTGHLDWVIVGGESGQRSRPCWTEWVGDVVKQCARAGVPCFVKQLGGHAVLDLRYDRDMPGWSRRLRDPKGGDMDEWPEGLRVREFPIVKATL